MAAPATVTGQAALSCPEQRPQPFEATRQPSSGPPKAADPRPDPLTGMADDVVGWRAKRDKMCGAWSFATSQLAQLYGLESHSPYTEPAFVEWALAHTG